MNAQNNRTKDEWLSKTFQLKEHASNINTLNFFSYYLCLRQLFLWQSNA